MLDRKNRLTAEKDFSRLFSKGRPFSGRLFAMKAASNNLGITRVGFVVSTKVSKRAVLRNALKRRMREIVRKRLPQTMKGVDAVFIARPGSTALEFKEIEAALVELMTRSGLISRK